MNRISTRKYKQIYPSIQSLETNEQFSHVNAAPNVYPIFQTNKIVDNSPFYIFDIIFQHGPHYDPKHIFKNPDAHITFEPKVYKNLAFTSNGPMFRSQIEALPTTQQSSSPPSTNTSLIAVSHSFSCNEMDEILYQSKHEDTYQKIQNLINEYIIEKSKNKVDANGETVRYFKIPYASSGSVLGMGGSTIEKITKRSGATVYLNHGKDANDMRSVVMKGTEKTIADAWELVQAVIEVSEASKSSS